jgi:tetratricopeptide (TPR) repeat protein
LDTFPLRKLGGRRYADFANKRVWVEKLPFFLLAVVAGVVGIAAKHHAGALGSIDAYGFIPRAFQAMYGIVFYLWRTILPLHLSPIYELGFHFNPWDQTRILAAISVLTISVALVIARRHWTAGLAAWAGYIVILAPVLGLFQSGPQLVADRYSYLSCLVWPILLAAGLLLFWRRWLQSHRRPPGLLLIVPAGAIMVATLGVLTWRQTRIWHDSETLWRHAIAVEPDSSVAHHNLAVELAKEPGKLEEATAHLREALKLHPNFPDAHVNLAKTLAVQGRLEDAIRHFYRALQIDPNFASAHHGLGNLLAMQGDLPESITHFKEALKAQPENPEIHNNLATSLLKLGLRKEAILHYGEALRISPGDGTAHYNLANALASQGDFAPAIEHYREALRVYPDAARIHESLGRALALAGRQEEAIRHYEEALKLLRTSRR